MKKKNLGFGLLELLVLLAIIGIVLSIIFASVSKAHACGWFDDCSTDTSNQNTFLKEQALTEVNQRVLEVAQPTPKLEDSTERQNLIKRMSLFNDPNKLSYIYLLSYGRVMAFYTIKGKVSSINSLLTNPTQLINSYYQGESCSGRSNGGDCQQVPSPDLDGTYGANGPEGTIFFFTSSNAYVEWHGDYMMSDQPLQLSTPPEMVMSVK